MAPSNESRRPHRTRRQCTAAALALLASVGAAQQVSAAEPSSGNSAAPGKIGAGPVLALAIDPDTPTTLYAGTEFAGVLKSLDGGDAWSAVNSGLTSTMSPAAPSTTWARLP